MSLRGARFLGLLVVVGGLAPLLWPLVPEHDEVFVWAVMSVLATVVIRALVRRVERTESRLRRGFNDSNVGICIVSVDHRYLELNDAMCAFLGRDRTELINRRFEDFTHPDDVEVTRDFADRALATGSGAVEKRYLRPGGSVRWGLVSTVIVHDAAGGPSYFFSHVQDITERKLAEESLRHAERDRERAERRFRVGFEQSTIGTAIADLDGRPFMVNAAVCRLLGRSRDELIGRRWDAFSNPEETPLGAAVKQHVDRGEDSYSDERSYRRADGSTVSALTNVTLVRDGDGRPSYYFAQFRDITARKQMEEDLRHQALHDTLTGLPNRLLLEDRLEQALARSARTDGRVGVVFLDLDRFKLINDAMGHPTGDLLVRAVGERLTEFVRPGDTVARFGGDEFVIICEQVGADALEHVADRVEAAFVAPFTVCNREVSVTASIGIVSGRAGDRPTELLRDADVAMYSAKERGRGRRQVFDQAMRASAARRFEREEALSRALVRGDFRVFYQPIVALDEGNIVGVEALVRLHDPDRGLVSPAEFIPLAEDTGLIVPLGEWVLNEAVAQVDRWRNEISGAGKLTLAVNLSARQLEDPSIDRVVRRALAHTDLPPSALHLEITESVVMRDIDHSVGTLNRLRAQGVHLDVDDFGTGYSSLGYLKHLPVDTLKIDRSFIDGLGIDPSDSSIVAAIVALGQALKLELLGEGIETELQLASLRGLGCQYGQGYLWAPPLPAADVAARLAQVKPLAGVGAR